MFLPIFTFRRVAWVPVFVGAVLLCGDGASWAADCNRNGIDDSADLEGGSSEDCNGNQVPDECEFAPLEFHLGEGFPLASTPLVAVAADFNGDGVVDLATGNLVSSTSTVSVSLSRGDGTFEPAVDFDAGRLLSSMTVAGL